MQADRLGSAPTFDASAKIGDLHTEALSLQVLRWYLPTCKCWCKPLQVQLLLFMTLAQLQRVFPCATAVAKHGEMYQSNAVARWRCDYLHEQKETQNNLMPLYTAKLRRCTLHVSASALSAGQPWLFKPPLPPLSSLLFLFSPLCPDPPRDCPQTADA